MVLNRVRAGMTRLLDRLPFWRGPEEDLIPLEDLEANTDAPSLQCRTCLHTAKRRLPCWSIACLLILVLSLSISLGVIVHQRPVLEPPAVNETEVKTAPESCLDAGCLWVGAQRVAAANTSVSPCDDFFQFACGGHRDSDPVLALNLRTSSTTDTKIHEMLLEQPEGEEADSADAKLRLLYRSCLSGETRGQGAAGRVLEHLQQMGGWWLVDPRRPSSFDLQGALQYTSATLDLDLFFTIHYTLFHASNYSVMNLDITPVVSPAILGHEPMTDQSRPLFEEYVASIAKLFLRDMTGDAEIAKERIQLFASDVLNMHQKLYENDKVKQGNHHRIAVFKVSTESSKPDFTLFPEDPAIDMNWADLMDARLGDTWKTEGQTVSFHSPWIIRAHVALLKSMVTEEKRMLNSYMVWKVLQSFIIAMPLEYRNVRETFMHRLGMETKERRAECQDMLTTELPESLGSLFARHYSETENKQMVTEMAELMREEFMKDIAQSPWMDDKTKKAAIFKVQNTKMLHEVPENLKNTTLIDEHHKELQIVQGAPFIDNYAAVRAFQRSILSKEVKEKSLDIYLVRRLFLFQILADTFHNVLGIPVTLLELPVFAASLPRHYNMASLGSLLGHNLDDLIKKFQGYWLNGLNLTSVYTPQSSIKWEEIIEDQSCVDDFLSQALPQYSRDAHRWFWLRHKGVLITETSGVRLAYKAYKTWRQQQSSVPEKIIPGIDLTPDQSFFMTYAQMKCLDDRHFYVTEDITPHDRVNFVLSQLPEFAEAFGCGGSPMNPEDKCVLNILQPSLTPA